MRIQNPETSRKHWLPNPLEDDWDEDAPMVIADPSASMPSGWLEEEPWKMADPNSKRPTKGENAVLSQKVLEVKILARIAAYAFQGLSLLSQAKGKKWLTDNLII